MMVNPSVDLSGAPCEVELDFFEGVFGGGGGITDDDDDDGKDAAELEVWTGAGFAVLSAPER